MKKMMMTCLLSLLVLAGCSSSSETILVEDTAEDRAVTDVPAETVPPDTTKDQLSDTFEVAPDTIPIDTEVLQDQADPDTDVPAPVDLIDVGDVPGVDTIDVPGIDTTDTEVDDPPEVQVDTGPDAQCVPDCTDKTCGSDGCGGICGYCPWGQICGLEGVCIDDVCKTNCEGPGGAAKVCGSDGCGGYCGFCQDGSSCGADGLCYPDACEGSCEDKDCGLDECGEVCGYCGEEQLCDEGTCVPHPCGDVTAKGVCTGKYDLEVCVDLEVQQTNCLSQPNSMCGWDAAQGKFACVEEFECQPNCLYANEDLKECGPDGCWGSCGMCPIGWACHQGGCLPGPGAECSWINSTAGTCFDHQWWFCSGGKLYSYDCFIKEGKTCGWGPNFNMGQGGYGCVPMPEGE